MACVSELSIGEVNRVVSTLKSAISPGYGPSFQHTLISTQTGRLMITNVGSQILKTVCVDHPVGKYIVSCASDHHAYVGDNSKTFIVLLSELSYRSSMVIQSASGGDRDEVCSRLRLHRDLEVLLAEILPQLFTVMSKHYVQYKVNHDVELTSGLTSMLQGVLNSHLLEYDCLHMSQLVTTWIKGWSPHILNNQNFTGLLDMLIDYTDVMVIENTGKPVSSSSILPGLLLSRGFCDEQQTAALSSEQPVKFLLLNCQIESIDDSMLNYQAELQLPEENHQETLSKIIGYKRLRTTAFLNLVRQMGIRLIFTSYSLSTLEKTQCSRYGIAAVHTVPEIEIDYVSNILNVQPLCSTLELTAANIGEARSCRQVLYGSQVYMHLEPNLVGLSVVPSCLLVSGPTDGMSQQLRLLVRDCLKTVRTSLWPPSHSLGQSFTTLSTENLSTSSSSHKSCQVAGSEGGDSGVCLSPNELLQSTSTQPVNTGASNLVHTPLGYEKVDAADDVMTCFPVGGGYEVCLCEVISHYLSTQKAGAPGTAALSVLRQSLLSIPQLLHTNAYYIAKPRWLSTLEDIQLSIKSGKIRGVDPTTGSACSTKLLHSSYSKQQLIVSVLVALKQLLKLDQIL